MSCGGGFSRLYRCTCRKCGCGVTAVSDADMSGFQGTRARNRACVQGVKRPIGIGREKLQRMTKFDWLRSVEMVNAGRRIQFGRTSESGSVP
jgi:hypothetical protein